MVLNANLWTFGSFFPILLVIYWPIHSYIFKLIKRKNENTSINSKCKVHGCKWNLFVFFIAHHRILSVMSNLKHRMAHSQRNLKKKNPRILLILRESVKERFPQSYWAKNRCSHDCIFKYFCHRVSLKILFIEDTIQESILEIDIQCFHPKQHDFRHHQWHRQAPVRPTIQRGDL